MNKNLLWVSSLCALSGLSTVALAHGGPEEWAKADKDGDGAVSSAEFEASALDHWAQADANKDGKVTADEMKAQMEKHKGAHGGMHGMGDMKGLPGDTNNDGAITKDEAQAESQKLFKMIDKNGDGKVTKDEIAAAHPGMPGKGGPGKGGKGAPKP